MSFEIKDLPESLTEYKDVILSSKKGFIKIELESLSSIDNYTISKVGGLPYLPQGEDYPLDSNGKPLQFLAQINCSELPENNLYPKEGIIQFYIGTDDLYGLDFDFKGAQKDYRVLFYPKVQAAIITDFKNIINLVLDDYSPIDVEKEYRMSFALEEEYVPLFDYQFEKYFKQSFFELIESFEEEEDEVAEFYEDTFDSSGHKMGGYAFFTQTDPRSFKNHLDDYQLLFQLDSEEDIMWGDSGVGNFFISKKDLENKDFSNVVYSWDCH